MPLIFNLHYLDQLLPYLKTKTSLITFGLMCDVMRRYLRYGIETRKCVQKKILFSNGFFGSANGTSA
jgi:hypothetical protein